MLSCAFIWGQMLSDARICNHMLSDPLKPLQISPDPRKCRGAARFLPLWVRGRVVCAMSRQVGHCAPVSILHANPHRSAQMLPNALICSHMLSYAITCSQMRSHALRCFQMFPNVPRRLLMLSDAFRCPRMLSDTFMYPQTPSDALRYSQML